MIADKQRIVVVPCSGIGKAYGSVSREAAYEVCEELRPDATRLLALSKLVLGDEEARNQVRSAGTITIDGCKLMCAAKLVSHSGGTTVREVAVLDVYRQHKDLKPEGIAELNEAGKELAKVIAREIAEAIDQLRGSTHGETSHA
ncbi:MAG: putative zinc-binding protein [Bacteroidales bacterium]